MSEVDSVGLDILNILSSSYLWLALVYAMMIIILIMHTTVSPVRGREVGEFKVVC